MRDTLVDYFSSEGFSVEGLGSTEEGIDAVDEQKFDLAIVDINLPGKSGFDMIEYIRDQGLDFPVLALTARDGITDKVKGFESGFNDYVVKPFDLRELLARVKAHMRLSQTNDLEAPIKTKNFTLEPKALRLLKNGSEIELTQLEFKLLHMLMMNNDSLVENDDLIEFAWGEHDDLISPPIRIHIANLRKKIGDEQYRIIKTVPGTGYIFRDE